MVKSIWQKAQPHVLAIILFVIVAFLYCKPVMEGKVLQQHDTLGWKGMVQQSLLVKEKTGKLPLWTNSMFGGMPAYQIAIEPTTKVGLPAEMLLKAFNLWLPQPMVFFFLASLSFYILCIVLGCNPWVAVFGGLAYAFSSYNPIIISAGHLTKMMSIAYAPMVLAGILLLFDKKYITGFAVTALFSAFMIGQNHLQIVYYLMIIIACVCISYLVYSFRRQETAHALKAMGLGLLAGLLGLGSCAVGVMTTYDYAKETMRGGKSQLTLNEEDNSGNKTKGGLNKDYALRWSVGKMETFTFLVPGLYGGSNGGNEHNASSSKMVEKFGELGVPEESAIGMANGYSYWGSMSSLNETTSGPVYLGVAVCLLFIIGLFYVSSWHKWWIIFAASIGILLAWGSNFFFFNSFLLDYLPFYSKFRAPSMALVIPQFCLPVMAALALQKLVNETDFSFAWKKIKIAGIVTASILALLVLFWLTADYTGKGDADIKNSFVQNFSRSQQGQQPSAQALQQVEQLSKELMSALKTDRKSEAGGDLLRSIFLAVVIGATVWLLLKKKMNPVLAVCLITAVSFIDLLTVDLRYLNYDKYKEQDDISAEFYPSPADEQILKDPDHANFRVFNQTGSFTNESLTSYFHNSVGGYHPAKLGLYQDLIEHQLSNGNMNVFNMLNTKYFITYGADGKPIAQQNPNAFGPCYLVKGIKFVHTPNDEMLALNNTDLKDTVVINDSFKSAIPFLPQYDSTAILKIQDRQNDKIVYTSNAASPQFAVFSEIYYNRGWDALLDGKKADYARVNYVLRGMALPAGQHTIEFRFEPKSYYQGNTIAFWCTILIYAVLLYCIYAWYKRKL